MSKVARTLLWVPSEADMPHPVPTIAQYLLSLLIVALPGHASAATGYDVGTVEWGTWAAAVAALREAPVGERPRLHVVVRNGHERLVPCGQYVLRLDETYGRAFAVGACDRADHSTMLVLVDRHALFSHSGGIAQPIIPLLRAEEPPPPPPPPPVPPPAVPTCWAVVGPLVIDAETGRTVPLDPGELTVDVVTVPPQAAVLRVAYDHGWLIRLRNDRGIQSATYGLVPWHTARHGALVPDPPAGLVRRNLPLRCEGDPMGPWPTPDQGELQVPDRIEAISADGQPVTLQRWRGEGSLWAQWISARLIDAVGGLGMMVSVPVLEIALSSPGTGVRFGPLRQTQWRAAGFMAASAALLGGGLYLELSSAQELTIRNGTHTVGAHASVPALPAAQLQSVGLAWDRQLRTGQVAAAFTF